MLSPSEARRILESADLICSAETVAAAVRRMAADISSVLSEANPLVLSVMGGAVVFTGHLLPQLAFPLDFDYLHVTRYGDETTGGELRWIAAPREAIAGRTVLVVDDILDEGVTLAAIHRRMIDPVPPPATRRCSPTRTSAAQADQGRFRRPDPAQPLRLRLRHGRQGRLAQPAGDLRRTQAIRSGWQDLLVERCEQRA